MITLILALIACSFALFPALLFRKNLRVYNSPSSPQSGKPLDRPAVSVLIPARNEENSIRAAVEAVLASKGVTLEVIVLDDHSQDSTAAVVKEMTTHDPRVRVVTATLLPPGWCGKQHACAVLAKLAAHPLLVFVDADVRLAPDGLARMIAFLTQTNTDLASGFPRQETGTFLEQLVIPLMHFLLLSFLPLERMRRSRHPAYGTGCGQLFITRRDAYEKAGGHGAIRSSLHDGLTLPRAFRAAGLKTDLFDATTVATCRMYRSAREVWCGLAKNATEGLATPATIFPVTVLLLGGQVLPLFLLFLGITGMIPSAPFGLALVGTVASYYPRLVALRRFHQPFLGALLHPLGILILLSIQWYAFFRSLWGRSTSWRGRIYPVS